MRWEDVADQSSLPNKFRLSFSTGALKHPPDGFIPVLRDGQFLDGFLSISAISSDRMITSLRDCTECFSSLKRPPDGFIPALRDKQFLDRFCSISAISSDRMIRRLRGCIECFSSLKDMADIDKNPPKIAYLSAQG